MEYFHTVKAFLPGPMSESVGPTVRHPASKNCQDLSRTCSLALQLQPLREFKCGGALCTSQVFRIGPWHDLPWPDQAVHSQHYQLQKLKRIAAFSQSGALAKGAVRKSTLGCSTVGDGCRRLVLARLKNQNGVRSRMIKNRYQ